MVSETYFFDKASEFKGIDSSRNNVFGVNVINMHNNQYGKLHCSNILLIQAYILYIVTLQMVQVYQIQPWNK